MTRTSRGRRIACNSTGTSPSATPRTCALSRTSWASRDCYASPYLKARPGSTHGYDITDHRSSTPRSAARTTSTTGSTPCAQRTMGDLSTSCPITWASSATRTRWWNDVLENGPASPFAGFFDIAWDAVPRVELQGRCCIPVLGDPYAQGARSQQLQLVLRRRRLRHPLLRPPLSGRAATATDDPRATGSRSWSSFCRPIAAACSSITAS